MNNGDSIQLRVVFENIKVDIIGTTSLEDWPDTTAYEQTRELLPGAKSIIIMAMEVFTETVNRLTSKALVGDLTLRDLYTANCDVVDGLLDMAGYKLVKRLHQSGYRALLLPAGGSPYDARFLIGPLSYKNAAEAAGMGVSGWHSLLITPEYGARVRLACAITDAPFQSTAAVDIKNPCPECGGACIKICPAKAIRKPAECQAYSIDKHACNNYYTASGACAECLKICPAGRTKN
jgi:epoxyqueuosine reductase QueG